LLEHFLASEGFNRNVDGARRVEEIAPDALEALQQYDWPGNVRELINVLERACSFAESKQIRFGELPEQIRRRVSAVPRRSPGLGVSMGETRSNGLAFTSASPPLSATLGLARSEAFAAGPATTPLAAALAGSGGGPVTAGEAEAPPDEARKTFKDAKEEWIASFERDYLLHLLRKNHMNISHAAREADIDRKYFRKLMRKYGLANAEGSTDEGEEE